MLPIIPGHSLALKHLRLVTLYLRRSLANLGTFRPIAGLSAGRIFAPGTTGIVKLGTLVFVMENLLKILRFLELALYVVGFIGGVGYAVYSHAYFVAVCVFALGIMALPEAVQAFKHLTK